MASKWDRVSITAHYTAQVWVRLGLDQAHRFDTRRGRMLYRAVQPLFAAISRLGITAPHDFCVQRHRMIDALLERLQPAQLIELACGLSPRCLAYGAASGRPCIDSDLPHVLQLKAQLAGEPLPAGYRQAPLDLVASGDYVDALLPGRPATGDTAVIIEGLFSYLPLWTQQQVFERVARLLRRCGGGVFITDIHHQHAVDQLGPVGSLFRVALGLATGTSTHPMVATLQQGQRMMLDAGFDAVQVHAPADWPQLAMPLRRIDSGMRIYQASAMP